MVTRTPLGGTDLHCGAGLMSHEHRAQPDWPKQPEKPFPEKIWVMARRENGR